MYINTIPWVFIYLYYRREVTKFIVHEVSRHFYIVFREIFKTQFRIVQQKNFRKNNKTKKLQQITKFAQNNEISREMYSKIQFFSEKFASRSNFCLRHKTSITSIRIRILKPDILFRIQRTNLMRTQVRNTASTVAFKYAQYLYRYLYRNNRSLHSWKYILIYNYCYYCTGTIRIAVQYIKSNNRNMYAS